MVGAGAISASRVFRYYTVGYSGQSYEKTTNNKGTPKGARMSDLVENIKFEMHKWTCDKCKSINEFPTENEKPWEWIRVPPCHKCGFKKPVYPPTHGNQNDTT